MAWNEPGSGNRDPWGGKNDQGPPDLEEVVRKMQEKLGGLFGGKKKSNGGSSKIGIPKGILQIVAIIILAVWGFAGLYTVEEGKVGIVTTFGQYSDTTPAGLQWMAIPFQKVQMVDVQKIHSQEIGYRSSRSNRAGGGSVPEEAHMLTEDENIIDIRLAVQYKISDPRAYLFNVFDPDGVLKQATESAIRQVVGQTGMDYILKEGRAQIASDAQVILQDTLDQFEAGLSIQQVTMQDAQPPEEVQAAFTDAVKAQEDRERVINEAQAYQRDILPKANGLATRRVEEAIAYKEKVTAEAKGESERFLKILAEYEKAPEITRQRLYIETMESVLSASSKVLLDVEGNNSLMYLPLDKLISARSENPQPYTQETATSTQRTVTQQDPSTQSRRTRIRGFK